MSTSNYERTVHSSVVYVRGGDISELRAACIAHDFEKEATWRIEDGAVVFETPLGEQLIGASPAPDVREQT